MKPLYLDGVTYTKQYVRGLKQPLLDVRDALIDAGKLPHAMSMSEIHALLDYYCENVDDAAGAEGSRVSSNFAERTEEKGAGEKA